MMYPAVILQVIIFIVSLSIKNNGFLVYHQV